MNIKDIFFRIEYEFNDAGFRVYHSNVINLCQIVSINVPMGQINMSNGKVYTLKDSSLDKLIARIGQED